MKDMKNDCNLECFDMLIDGMMDSDDLKPSTLQNTYLGLIARSLAQIADELNRMNLRSEKDGNDD